MKISVIVAVYNSANYIKQCIESIRSQTYEDFEIIIVDDGSNDGTHEICYEAAQVDHRIALLRIRRHGVLYARRLGLEISRGEYTLIVDGDDWLEPDMIEKLYKGILRHGADISVCGRVEESGGSSRNVRQGFRGGYYDRNALETTIYPAMISNGDFFSWGIFPSLWDKLIRRDLLDEPLSQYTEMFPIGNDAVVTYPVLLKANSIEILDDCLYHYRQNSTSMVHTTPDNAREGYRQLYYSLECIFSKHALGRVLWRQWTEYVLFLMIPRVFDLYPELYEREELFPFKGVKKGSRVIIYGMGLYGKRLHKFLEDTGYCTVVAAIDRDYETLCKGGFIVEPPESIAQMDYDAVLLALSYANTRKVVKEVLREFCPIEKIHEIDLRVALGQENLRVLGLL